MSTARTVLGSWAPRLGLGLGAGRPAGLVAAAGADPEEIRTRADEILSRPEYREAEPGLVERFLEWIGRHLGDLVGPVAGTGAGHWFGYALLGVAALAAAYFVWRVLPRGMAWRRPSSKAAVTHETIGNRTRSEWLARADRAEADGRWDDAVHARYHALTSGLADRREVPAAEATTSGEHRQAFADRAGSDPARVAAFAQATDRFEWVWFGGADTGAVDARALAEVDRRLLEDRS